jgi:hypothetical protein
MTTMDDADLDRIETNARVAGLCERDVERVFALARRGLRAEHETYGTFDRDAEIERLAIERDEARAGVQYVSPGGG